VYRQLPRPYRASVISNEHPILVSSVLDSSPVIFRFRSHRVKQGSLSPILSQHLLRAFEGETAKFGARNRRFEANHALGSAREHSRSIAVRNRGGSESPSSRVRFYWSSDATITTADTQLADRYAVPKTQLKRPTTESLGRAEAAARRGPASR